MISRGSLRKRSCFTTRSSSWTTPGASPVEFDNTRQVDVAQVISNKIHNIAISGHTLGSKVPVTLAYPGLIIGLCIRAGVEIPMVMIKVIRSVVNDDYVLR
ncbi:hypothetical protein RYX36_000234, partial [Vicia faba]